MISSLFSRNRHNFLPRGPVHSPRSFILRFVDLIGNNFAISDGEKLPASICVLLSPLKNVGTWDNHPYIHKCKVMDVRRSDWRWAPSLHVQHPFHPWHLSLSTFLFTWTIACNDDIVIGALQIFASSNCQKASFSPSGRPVCDGYGVKKWIVPSAGKMISYISQSPNHSTSFF